MPMRAKKQERKYIPRIQELPFIGSTFAYNNNRLSFYRCMYQTCGDAGIARLGFLRTIFFNSSETIGEVLVEHNSDFGVSKVVQNAFASLASNGLLTSSGDFHRHQRKLMAPSFQPKHIMTYADTVVQYGEQTQGGWNDGSVIDIGQEMTHITMNSLGKVLFDTDLANEADKLGMAMKIVLDHIDVMLSYPVPLSLRFLLPRYSRVRKAANLLKRKIQEMIDERRTSSEEQSDLLSLLLQSQEDESSMSDKQVYDEILTLIFAGHDTITQALTWAWYLLITHPENYQKVQQEVDHVLQGRSPIYKDLTDLPYTLKVLKEAMRMYPPIHAIVRVARQEGSISGFHVCRGDTILISPYIVHHRSDYFPEPQRFDPERFSPQIEKNLPRYAYIPFGAGPRICIGMHFAMMEGHLLLATLAQRVSFELVAGQKIEMDPKVTLRPRNGIHVAVRHRGMA
jgi:cytochrome P450